jgi:hypothetical protein
VQGGGINDAPAGKADDPRRDGLAALLVAWEYVKIGARKLECR